METEERESPTSDSDAGPTYHAPQPSRPPSPLAAQASRRAPHEPGYPSPCCCPAEGHRRQGAWGPQSPGPPLPALTSPPAGPVRRTPGLGVRLGSTPQCAQTADASYSPMTMWVGAAGPFLLHPSRYLGLGLRHAVLGGQQLLIDLLQARSADLSAEKGAREGWPRPCAGPAPSQLGPHPRPEPIFDVPLRPLPGPAPGSDPTCSSTWPHPP